MSESNVFDIAVIGLGYAGLPLARLFLESGHVVYGIDVNRDKIKRLLKKESYLVDLPSKDLTEMFDTGRFYVGSRYSVIAGVDAVIFCLPTPLDSQANPDLTYVFDAVQQALAYLRPGQLVVLESTTYPGTTEEHLCQLIESGGLKVGEDVALAYSPERIDPGQRHLSLKEIPKIVSGVTPTCTRFARKVYATAFEQVVVVSKPRTAEMAKLLENCQRYVNISLMNEMVELCDHMDIDLWEVIASAATKPYGFTEYYPGPGIGGHCIPVDPLYLQWRAKQFGTELKLIDAARQINERAPGFVVAKVAKHVSSVKPLSKSRILAVGVTYKKDVGDIRESAAIKVLEGLRKLGMEVNYYDPFVERLEIDGVVKQGVPLTEQTLQEHDCTVILTDHSGIDYRRIVRHSPLIVDTRNVTSPLQIRDNVVLL